MAEEKSITLREVLKFTLILLALGFSFLGWLFVLNAEGKLNIKGALDYTTLGMAFAGLVLSLLATVFSLVAYYDGKMAMNRVFEKLDAIHDRLPQNYSQKQDKPFIW